MGNWKDKVLPVLMIAVVALAFGGGMLWTKVTNLEKGTTQPATVAGTGQQQPAVQPTQAPISLATIKGLFKKDLVKMGDGSKKLLMVEVSDPSCPFCSIASGENAALNNQAGDRFKMVADGGTYVAPVPEMEKLITAGKADFVWIYSPGHGNGEMGAKALYCANEKGKFWQVSDLLMSAKGYDLLNNTVKNDKTQSGALAAFLAPAMSAADMKSCLDSGKYDKRPAADQAIAASIGVQGTPGFFLNTTNFAGAYSWVDMKSAADAALK
jgi:protein-disulfide isomerase